MQESKPKFPPEGHVGPYFTVGPDVISTMKKEEEEASGSTGYVKTNPKNDVAKLQRMVKRACERDLNFKFSEERKNLALQLSTKEFELKTIETEAKLKAQQQETEMARLETEITRLQAEIHQVQGDKALYVAANADFICAEKDWLDEKKELLAKLDAQEKDKQKLVESKASLEKRIQILESKVVTVMKENAELLQLKGEAMAKEPHLFFIQVNSASNHIKVLSLKFLPSAPCPSHRPQPAKDNKLLKHRTWKQRRRTRARDLPVLGARRTT